VERHNLTPAVKFAQRATGDPAAALRTDVDTIAELGIPYLLHIPISPGPKFADERIGEMVWFTRVEAWFRMIDPAIRRAERRGVTILFKPHGGIAGTGEDLAALVERIGSPAVRVAYDPGNVVYYEGVRPEPDIVGVADLVRALIIKDHRGGQAVVAIFRTLHHANFTGPVLIERIDGLDSPAATDHALARGRSYLERAILQATTAE
jgi:sugar phosphate isomerase/epimerase